MKTKMPKTALIICLTLSVLLSACGVGAPAAMPTAVDTNTSLPPTVTPTATLTPTNTPTPTRTPLPTATPNLAATQEYNDFIAMVQKIYEAGQISTLDGTYSKLDDYSDELAMSYGYSWNPTGKSAKSFIVRADFDWEVANQRNNSGCGYKFRQELVSGQGTTYTTEYYYFAVLDALNGVLVFYPTGLDYKRASLVKKNDKPEMGANPYHAQFTLVVSATSAYTYVNGELFTEHKLQTNFITSSGPLEYVVLTGSDTDYGTRCKITNVELWVIEP